MNHIFHLGRDPELSALEIVSFLDRTNRGYKLLKITKKIMLISLDKFDPIYAIKALGGTIKISSEIDNPENYITKELSLIKSKKINYGINEIESSKEAFNNLTDIIKITAKKEKLRAFHKQKTEREIPPSKSKNLDLELTLYKNNIYKVSAVSDPKSYEKRDEKRPYFDPLKVISVRLAKILINLAQPKKNSVLLDPFAGLGTILQEASLIEIKSMGLDKDPLTVKKCQKNLIWAKDKFKFKVFPKVIRLDVGNMSKSTKNIDCIATEPYLGPYLRKLPKEQEARKIAEELSKLYEKFLRESSKMLKKGSKIAVIIPTFKTRDNKLIRVGFQSMIKKYNFDIFQPLKNNIIPLDYTMKGSKLRRKIYVLEKV
ncbi:MAG: DNA methyltransferase [Nanoarchaeota archaeon]|nr:DNA methyltransferase [Nanoarchaeota archaeon]